MALFICFIEINNSFIININFCNYESGRFFVEIYINKYLIVKSKEYKKEIQ